MALTGRAEAANRGGISATRCRLSRTIGVRFQSQFLPRRAPEAPPARAESPLRRGKWHRPRRPRPACGRGPDRAPPPSAPPPRQPNTGSHWFRAPRHPRLHRRAWATRAARSRRSKGSPPLSTTSLAPSRTAASIRVRTAAGSMNARSSWGRLALQNPQFWLHCRLVATVAVRIRVNDKRGKGQGARGKGGDLTPYPLPLTPCPFRGRCRPKEAWSAW